MENFQIGLIIVLYIATGISSNVSLSYYLRAYEAGKQGDIESVKPSAIFVTKYTNILKGILMICFFPIVLVKIFLASQEEDLNIWKRLSGREPFFLTTMLTFFTCAAATAGQLNKLSTIHFIIAIICFLLWIFSNKKYQ